MTLTTATQTLTGGGVTLVAPVANARQGDGPLRADAGDLIDVDSLAPADHGKKVRRWTHP